MTDPIPPTLSALVLREKFGLSKSYASELMSGRRKPSLELAVRIEREIGVPASSWVEAGDGAFIERQFAEITP